MDERVVTNHELEEDTFEKSIRPDSFDEYIGQTDVKENIKVFVKAAKSLDMAAQKGTVHKNMAARKKSRLAAKLNAMA